jgi:hypothetical protein
MGYRMLSATDAYWRPSTQMGVLNADLAKQLEADTMGARLWRVGPRVRRRPVIATENERALHRPGGNRPAPRRVHRAHPLL